MLKLPHFRLIISLALFLINCTAEFILAKNKENILFEKTVR